MDAYPQAAAVDALKSLITGVLGASGLDPERGFKLPGLFEEAGIGVPDGTAVETEMDSLATVRAILLATFESFVPAGLRLGVIDAGTARRFAEDLDSAIRGPKRHYFLRPLVTAAWKRKTED